MANDVIKLLIIVLCIDMFIFIGQHSINSINPDAPNFYNGSQTILEKQNKGTGNNYYLKTDNATENIISGDTPPASVTLATIIDPFTAVKNWVVNKFAFLGDFFFAPYNALNMMNVPDDISFIFGAFWFVLTLTLISLLIVGRLY